MHLVQVASPVVAAMVPGAHAVALVAPVGQAEPAGHVVQSLCAWPFVALRNEPAAHAVGAEAPARQNEPAGQAVQDEPPLEDW